MPALSSRRELRCCSRGRQLSSNSSSALAGGRKFSSSWESTCSSRKTMEPSTAELMMYLRSEETVMEVTLQSWTLTSWGGISFCTGHLSSRRQPFTVPSTTSPSSWQKYTSLSCSFRAPSQTSSPRQHTMNLGSWKEMRSMPQTGSQRTSIGFFSCRLRMARSSRLRSSRSMQQARPAVEIATLGGRKKGLRLGMVRLSEYLNMWFQNQSRRGGLAKLSGQSFCIDRTKYTFRREPDTVTSRSPAGEYCTICSGAVLSLCSRTGSLGSSRQILSESRKPMASWKESGCSEKVRGWSSKVQEKSTRGQAPLMEKTLRVRSAAPRLTRRLRPGLRSVLRTGPLWGLQLTGMKGLTGSFLKVSKMDSLSASMMSLRESGLSRLQLGPSLMLPCMVTRARNSQPRKQFTFTIPPYLLESTWYAPRCRINPRSTYTSTMVRLSRNPAMKYLPTQHRQLASPSFQSSTKRDSSRRPSTKSALLVRTSSPLNQKVSEQATSTRDSPGQSLGSLRWVSTRKSLYSQTARLEAESSRKRKPYSCTRKKSAVRNTLRGEMSPGTKIQSLDSAQSWERQRTSRPEVEARSVTVKEGSVSRKTISRLSLTMTLSWDRPLLVEAMQKERGSAMVRKAVGSRCSSVQTTHSCSPVSTLQRMMRQPERLANSSLQTKPLLRTGTCSEPSANLNFGRTAVCFISPSCKSIIMTLDSLSPAHRRKILRVLGLRDVDCPEHEEAASLRVLQLGKHAVFLREGEGVDFFTVVLSGSLLCFNQGRANDLQFSSSTNFGAIPSTRYYSTLRQLYGSIMQVLNEKNCLLGDYWLFRGLASEFTVVSEETSLVAQVRGPLRDRALGRLRQGYQEVHQFFLSCFPEFILKKSQRTCFSTFANFHQVAIGLKSYLFREGGQVDQIILLKRGAVHFERSHGSSTIPIASVQQSGEILCFATDRSKRHSLSAYCYANSELIVLPLANFAKLPVSFRDHLEHLYKEREFAENYRRARFEGVVCLLDKKIKSVSLPKIKSSQTKPQELPYALANDQKQKLHKLSLKLQKHCQVEGILTFKPKKAGRLPKPLPRAGGSLWQRPTEEDDESGRRAEAFQLMHRKIRRSDDRYFCFLAGKQSINDLMR